MSKNLVYSRRPPARIITRKSHGKILETGAIITAELTTELICPASNP